MARSKQTKPARAASKRLWTNRSLVVAQNKASEAVRNIAAKAAKQMFDKKKKAQDMKAKPPKKNGDTPTNLKRRLQPLLTGMAISMNGILTI